MKTSTVPVLTLTGSPREQGARYGELAAEDIATAHEVTRRTVTDAGLDADRYVRWLGAGQPYAATVAALTPDYWSFLQGLAEGSGRPLDWTVAQNLWDEDDWSRSFGPIPARFRSSERCTAITGGRDGRMIGGQNMDIGVEFEGTQLLLHFDESTAPRRLVLTSAGISGLCGVNAAGLGLFMNTLDQLNSSANGLPVTAFVFELLRCSTVAEASRRLSDWPHASGQAYTLVGPGETAGFECSAAGARAYPALPTGHRVHTNHPLVESDRREAESAEERSAVADGRGSCVRFDTARQIIEATPQWSADAVAAVLSSRRDERAPISKTAGDNERKAIGYTFGSMICDNSSPDEVSLRVAGGPPSNTEYVALEFDAAQTWCNAAERTTVGQLLALN